MTGSPPLFVAESFAPWCEKARWALDHHRVRYREREHVPLLGEPGLRWATRRLRGVVTVPVLITERRALMGSLEIARYAEMGGSGPPLIPEGAEAPVLACNALSEVIMQAGRALLLPRLLEDRPAVREQLPRWIPDVARPACEPAARATILYLMRKYRVLPEERTLHERRMDSALRKACALFAHARPYMLEGRLTLADIAVATALQFLRPVDDQYIRLGPAARAAWTHRDRAIEYAELLTWRDRLYKEARRGSPRTAGARVQPPTEVQR